MIIDNRDHDLRSQQGSYTHLQAIPYFKLTTTDHTFVKNVFDQRWYSLIAPQQLIATQIYAASLTGTDIPFGLLSGVDGLRGYYERRWIDRNSLLLQTEYRFPLSTLWSGALFWSAGQVADSFNKMTMYDLKTSAGGGIRYWLAEKDSTCIRFDLALTPKSWSTYVMLHEAF